MYAISISIVLYKPETTLFISVLESLTTAVNQLNTEYTGSVLLIIVDNSVEKNKDNLEQIARLIWVGQLTFIQAPKNLGFSKGHNQAIKLSQSDYHLILNPDVILDENALLHSLNYLQTHPQTVLVSPYTCSEEGERQYLCKYNPSILDLFLRGFAPSGCQRYFSKRLNEYEMKGKTEALELTGVSIVSGCYMFLRKKSFDTVGGFSEDFFLYFEDFDLSIKLQKLGTLDYVPSVKIIHFGGQAAKKGMRHIFLFIRSMCLFFNKHGWRWY